MMTCYALITISLSAKTLTYRQPDCKVLTYPVAIGKVSTPTPTGNFMIYRKYQGNDIPSMGGLFLAFKEHPDGSEYGMHGVSLNKEASIGKAVSLGCIRLRQKHMVQLYPKVKTGTPVVIR
jgi:lipoprotein-anchoring transpeptidase ErfK/SrfK